MVLDALADLDKAFASCFRRAKEKGELAADADPAVLGQLASAALHTLAVRSRAGVPRKELEAIMRGALDVMLR
jgi:TetR/AcrR family transcriptional regulator, copper-responsive repressor